MNIPIPFAYNMISRKHKTSGRGKNNKFIKKFLTHFRYYLSVSSVHGLNHIARSSLTIIEKLLWVCLVWGSFYFGLSKSLEIFVHYRTRPTVMAVEKDYNEWLAEFPSVTVCQKGINRAKARSYIEKNNIIIDNATEFWEYIDLLVKTNMNSYHLLQPYADGSKKEYLKPKQYFTFLSGAMKFVYKTSFGTIFPMGRSRPIRQVFTEVGPCSVLNPYIQIYSTPEYVNRSDPYEFNPIKYNMTIETSLDFRVFQQLDDNFDVYIHSPYDIINIESKSFQGQVFFRNNYYVNTKNIYTEPEVKALSIEQRKCKLLHENLGMDHSPLYSYGTCRNECRIKLSLKYCNCVPYYYRRNEGEVICNMTGMYCLSKHAEELVKLEDVKTKHSICDCYANCDNIIVIFDTYRADSFPISTDLVVAIASIKQSRYVRNLIFSKLDMLVQIGGIFGLCLGCSILSIIEIIYFATLRFFWGTVRAKSIKSSL